MKEYLIGPSDEGIRLDKQLSKILDNAGNGFIYKMLRKKNITLNDKKAGGSEHLKAGDVIKIYLSDETFEKFSRGGKAEKIVRVGDEDNIIVIKDIIIHEDDDILILNKPSGLLSQKADVSDLSINELCLNYLLDKGELSDDSLNLFKPSICNRLDRNTSGIIVFAKTYKAAALFAGALKDRTIHKYYLCLVKGRIDKEGKSNAFLIKDEKSNKVKVSDEESDRAAGICTAFRPLAFTDEYTLLEVDLITGKSHQIRAQMAYLGHPLIGDYKYGDRKLNDYLKSRFKVSSQALHAYKIVIPEQENDGISMYSGTYIAQPPEDMQILISRLLHTDIKDILNANLEQQGT